MESNIVDNDDASTQPKLNENKPKTIMKLLQNEAPFCVSPRSNNAKKSFNFSIGNNITPGSSIKIHRRIQSMNQ